jgi:hypothetical protein
MLAMCPAGIYSSAPDAAINALKARIFSELTAIVTVTT